MIIVSFFFFFGTNDDGFGMHFSTRSLPPFEI